MSAPLRHHPHPRNQPVPAHVTATRRRLRITTEQPLPRSVDIRIDGRRVWSTDAAASAPHRDQTTTLFWPTALRPHLRGRGTISVHDSATGAELATGQVRFGASHHTITITDGRGRHLAVNKWGRLGASLDGDDGGMRARLIERTRELIDDLHRLGHTAYICSGTLLGGIRSGKLLPHDDDTDIGLLLPHDHPSDLSLASYRLEDQLTERGYLVVRHSTVHLQITYLLDNGDTDCYIDIFTAFFRKGEFNQPFHIRTPDVSPDSITPLGTLTVEGVDFPTPARPEDWLAACYGPGWRVPDPSFHFDTPISTRRRFDAWFGDSFNLNRIYWEGRHKENRTSRLGPGDAAHLRALSRRLPKNAPVLDLGTGTGAIAGVIAEHGHDVVALDYSFVALHTARENHQRVDFRWLNLNDRRRMLELGVELATDSRDWHVNANHILEGLTDGGRETVLLFLRALLRGGGFALATIDTNLIVRKYSHENPETWHLPVEKLRNEAARWGLTVDTIETGRRRTRLGVRRTVTVVIRRTDGTE